MEKTRLFIALDLPVVSRRKVYKICDGIDGVRWTKRGQLHLTLSFLGDTGNKIIPQLSEALSSLKFKPFELTISDTGFFRSNIFFLEIEESAALNNLKEQIDDALYKIPELKASSRDFIPHITLARFKKRLSSGKIKFLTQAFAPILPEKFTVDNFILYSSKTNSDGAIHTPLKTVDREEV